jgi:deoxyribonuclease-4
MLIGAHVSPAGGLHLAVDRGRELGARSIQIFNQSPRMWRPTAYASEDFERFGEALEGSQIAAVLIHAVYLLNCASEDPDIRTRSLASLTHSLRVGDAIGATGVVLHPGSAKGGDARAAVARAGAVIAEALSESERCPLHLENTAGAGGTLGRSFEELGALIEAAGGDQRLGLCLDSCHLLASGYEVRTAAGLDQTLERCHAAVGLERLSSIHLNDSLTGLGSNRDRHAAPGTGEIGRDGLSIFLSEPRFEGKPVVLETGSADGAVAAADIELAHQLREDGLAMRRAAGAEGAAETAATLPRTANQ